MKSPARHHRCLGVVKIDGFRRQRPPNIRDSTVPISAERLGDLL
jgi:hypothetical protein